VNLERPLSFPLSWQNQEQSVKIVEVGTASDEIGEKHSQLPFRSYPQGVGVDDSGWAPRPSRLGVPGSIPGPAFPHKVEYGTDYPYWEAGEFVSLVPLPLKRLPVP